jgi:hypothetical protein
VTTTAIAPARELADDCTLIELQQGNYENRLRDLAGLTAGNDRATALEDMAWWAEEIADSADLYTDGMKLVRERAKWTFTATVCRAIAATERGYILVDPEDVVKWLAASDWAWEALIQNAGKHAERAEILHALYEQFARVPGNGAALVLDDIAATELTAAGLLVLDSDGRITEPGTTEVPAR